MRGRVTARDLVTRLKEMEPARELVITANEPESSDSVWTWKLLACGPYETLWEFYGWVSGSTYNDMHPVLHPLSGRVTVSALIELLSERDTEALLAMTGYHERKLVETRASGGQPKPSARPLWRV